MAQIFVLGLCLAALLRRGRLEVAISAHVGLNIAVVLAALAVGL